MPLQEPKELYYLDRDRGLSIVDVKNNVIGFHSGTAAIAHDGKSIGQIYIIGSKLHSNKGVWISGKAVRIHGMGIKLVEDYTVWGYGKSDL